MNCCVVTRPAKQPTPDELTRLLFGVSASELAKKIVTNAGGEFDSVYTNSLLSQKNFLEGSK